MNAHAKIDAEQIDGALVALPAPETALAAFKTKEGIEPFLRMVRGHIEAFEGDVSTSKGRKEIASIAAKVARSKTALDDVGKGLVAELKELPKQIDATRKYMRDTLDAWKDEVRAPLTQWEDAEAARVAKHETAIREIEQIATGLVAGRPMTSAEIGFAIARLADLGPGDDGEDFTEAYDRLKSKAAAALTEMGVARAREEAERAELEQLRREKAEREAKEQAEAAAKVEAERIEQMRRQAEEEAQRKAREAIEAAERAAEDAKRRADEAEDRARANLELATKRAAEEQARQAQNRSHQAAINRKAVAGFVSNGLEEELAKNIVTMIAKDLIPHIQINY